MTEAWSDAPHRAHLAGDAPAGLCVQCLLKAGLESQAAPLLAPVAQTQSSPPSTAGFVPPLPAELAVRFPQLEIVELLGQGGMGAVYKARQPSLDRLVALKILPSEASSDPAFTECFTREARALARLSHPHIVTVHDFGQVDGQFYFVMEFVDGVISSSPTLPALLGGFRSAGGPLREPPHERDMFGRGTAELDDRAEPPRIAGQEGDGIEPETRKYR